MSRESDRAPLGVGFGEGLVGSRMERVEGERTMCVEGHREGSCQDSEPEVPQAESEARRDHSRGRRAWQDLDFILRVYGSQLGPRSSYLIGLSSR